LFFFADKVRGVLRTTVFVIVIVSSEINTGKAETIKTTISDFKTTT
jgi:hypothetical protein